jgi:Na+/melibiose symporter-like transporter
VIPILMIRRYKITRAVHADIRAQLDARRSARPVA